MRNRLVLFLNIILGGGLLVSLGQSNGRSYPPVEPPPSIADVRPSREWRVYYMLDDGSRAVDLIEVTSADEALAKFRLDHGPDINVTCMASAHYNFCIERVW